MRSTEIALQPTFSIIFRKSVSEAQFVKFWRERYYDPRERLYRENIGKPLTPKRLLALFEWKNGGPIARRKLASIRHNYIARRPIPPAPEDREALIRFITQPGGAIWRIFWLHCHNRGPYPMFDQHVYRAMKKLITGTAAEIPATSRGKAIAYVDEYLPFHANLLHRNKKELDEALWAYGKFLKGRYAL